MAGTDPFTAAREQMVMRQLIERGIRDERVIEAMRHVPRHEFISSEARPFAYQDGPLPIGEQQTISQPYMVAFMTELLGLTGNERVLEIGTGSGYQTAVLCSLAAQVYSLERLPSLAERAADTLERLGYRNVEIHIGDGSQGLPDMAPFEAILVAAAAPALPGPLRSQMSKDGGRLVMPVGSDQHQQLERVVRHDNQWRIEHSIPVRFVPLVGRYGFQADRDESET